MNCPRCGKPIGGYVQAGTIENARVAKGLCPHCGCSMPSGYKVGYKSDFAPPPPQKYDWNVINELNRYNPYRVFCVCLNGALTILFGILNGTGQMIVGIIVGVLMALSGIFYYALAGDPMLGFDYRDFKKTTTAPRNSVLMVATLIIGCFLSLNFALTANGSNKAGNLPDQWYWILIAFGISTALQVPMWRKNYKNALSTVQAAESVLTGCGLSSDMLDAIKGHAAKHSLPCAACGQDVGQYRMTYAAHGKGSGAIIICGVCLAKAGVDLSGKKPMDTIEINDMKFLLVSNE